MLTLRVGGDITLEEKLLLKQFKELEKFSLSPTSGDGTNRRIAPRSAKSLRSEAKTKVYDSKPRAFIEFIMELNLDKDQLGDELEKYLAKQEQHFQNAIGNIKRWLEKEKLLNRKLRHINATRGKETRWPVAPETAKSESLQYFSGMIHETSPTQSNTMKKKYTNNIIRTRGKTAVGARKKVLKNTFIKQSM